MPDAERQASGWVLDLRGTSSLVFAGALLIGLNIAAYFLISHLIADLLALFFLVGAMLLVNRAAAKRAAAEEALRQSRDLMETRVQQRTVLLARVNEVLQTKIAEHHQAEERAAQAAKMEAVGRLAAGVAHDFNNLLTVILGTSDLLLSELPRDAPERAFVEEILKAGERSAALTRQLLAFSHQQPLAAKAVELNEIVSGISRMVPRLLGNDIQLAVVLSEGRSTIFADAGQMEQVLLNLAANARDAMPTGGKLTMETQSVELDETDARAHEGLRPGNYVLLAVSDTGCGMTETVRSHLFEPFFTTKEKGKGTGLGLAMVYGIVKQCRGHIAVYSEPDHGTLIKIFLPRWGSNAEPVEQVSNGMSPPGGSETVLVVEDDKSIRSLLTRVLCQRGYRMLEAAGGDEALKVALQFPEPIDLLLIDVVMPGMNGREVADRLVQERNSLRVLFLSGYAEHAVVRHGVLEANRAFLHKPFSPDALARKVRAVLDEA